MLCGGCNKPVTTNNATEVAIDTVAKQKTEEIKKVENAVNDCTRGKATPILKKDIYPAAEFKLQADSLTGIEAVPFMKGTNLTIKNGGCESYVLTFRFASVMIKGDTADLHFWYGQATYLLTEMMSGVDVPFDYKRAVTYLANYHDRNRKNNYKDLKLREEIDFGQSEIREYVMLDNVQQLGDTSVLEITFVVGPL